MANILVVGPHPDDQELGMGGTIIQLAEQGHNVLLLDMTNGEPTPHGSPEQRKREWEAASKIMNVDRRLLGLTNREVTHSIEARHAVAAVIREHQASTVFLPYPEDAHPDHVATTRIVEDARFDAKLTKTNIPGSPIYPRRLIYYFCTHLRIVPQPTFCFDISPAIDRKIDAINAYETQFVIPEKNRAVVHWLREMNHYMGSRIGTDYAEPFWTREPIGLTSLEGMLVE
ncbi:MAG: PIG-L family deacetylase [Planctomycetota bacterium]